MKLLVTIATELIATAVTIGILSIRAFDSGWSFPIDVALSDMSILLPLANAAS